MEGRRCAHCGAAARQDDDRCQVCGASLARVASEHATLPGQGIVTAHPEAPTARTAPANPATPPPQWMPWVPPGWPAPPPANPAGSLQPDSSSPATTWGYLPYPLHPGYAPYAGAPAYPGYWAVPGYPPPYEPTAGQGTPGAPQGQFSYAAGPQQMYPYLAQPPRAQGEVYRLVITWIVLVGGVLAVVGGLVLLALSGLTVATAAGTSLNVINSLVGLTLPLLFGGVCAIFFSISGFLRRQSHRLVLPPWWLFGALTLAVLAAGIWIWTQYTAPGPALDVAPISIMSGVLPALAIVALIAWRLRMPTSQRHFWLSLSWGAAMAPLLAAVIELLLGVVLVVVMRQLGFNVSNVVTNINSVPRTGPEIVALLIMISVIAPIAEEGLKPLAALLVIRRVRTPSEAFLLGLAAGVGFDMVETIGYIGLGQADWVSIAIQRLGAGLLHGTGAAMAALGWYYLINGKGVRLRWLRGFGGLFYAVAQHAIFNAANLIGLIPGPVGNLFAHTFYLGPLPLDVGTLFFYVIYALILVILLYVSGRLARADARGRPPANEPVAAVPRAATPTLTGGVR